MLAEQIIQHTASYKNSLVETDVIFIRILNLNSKFDCKVMIKIVFHINYTDTAANPNFCPVLSCAKGECLRVIEQKSHFMAFFFRTQKAQKKLNLSDVHKLSCFLCLQRCKLGKVWSYCVYYTIEWVINKHFNPCLKKLIYNSNTVTILTSCDHFQCVVQV